MKPNRFSPITSQEALLDALSHIHIACHALCKKTFGRYYPVAGNIGVFCHTEEEYEFLTGLRKELTDESDNWNGKYFRLHSAITIPADNGIPQATYTHLYIRKPDDTHPQVGDLDFVMDSTEFAALKQSLLSGRVIPGARILDRPDLDLIELSDEKTDAYAYMGNQTVTESIRKAHSSG